MLWFSVQVRAGPPNLAGGKSSGMGRDKALLEVQGRPFARAPNSTRARNRHAGDFCIRPRRKGVFRIPLPRIADGLIDAGPLAGIKHALDASTSPLVRRWICRRWMRVLMRAVRKMLERFRA
jgi:molybdopterin-guanine dinucleotide biosynthesis protein A